jgi:antitoxin component of MazEF toxin-antitoxin module
MIEVETKLKRWGRSFGIIIPMEKVKEANLAENETLDVVVTKKKNPLQETFGKLKFKKSTKELLKESDREAWDE